MSKKIELTATQYSVLQVAAENNKGTIDWMPDHIRGGAYHKVIAGLVNKGYAEFVEGKDNNGKYVMTDAGYEAIGETRPAPTPVTPARRAARPTAPGKADTAQDDAPKTPRRREDSKQAAVIAMLSRAAGATIAQIQEITGWQKHTIRGTFAGTFKNRLGLTVTSSKEPGCERVYRLAQPTNA